MWPPLATHMVRHARVAGALALLPSALVFRAGVHLHAGAVLFNGLGRYEEAFAAARQGSEHEDFGLHGWCLIELVEAAARTGELEAAADAVRRLEERAGISGTDWGLGSLARAQALLADDETADITSRRQLRTVSWAG